LDDFKTKVEISHDRCPKPPTTKVVTGLPDCSPPPRVLSKNPVPQRGCPPEGGQGLSSPKGEERTPLPKEKGLLTSRS